jgi:hypothetical protein
MATLKEILRSWDAMRIFRMTMGIIALGQAIYIGEFLIGVAGAFLIFMALANIGCCGAGGCGFSTIKKPGNSAEDISFEVVTNEKSIDGKNNIGTIQQRPHTS